MCLGLEDKVLGLLELTALRSLGTWLRPSVKSAWNPPSTVSDTNTIACTAVCTTMHVFACLECIYCTHTSINDLLVMYMLFWSHSCGSLSGAPSSPIGRSSIHSDCLRVSFPHCLYSQHWQSKHTCVHRCMRTFSMINSVSREVKEQDSKLCVKKSKLRGLFLSVYLHRASRM